MEYTPRLNEDLSHC